MVPFIEEFFVFSYLAFFLSASKNKFIMFWLVKSYSAFTQKDSEISVMGQDWMSCD